MDFAESQYLCVLDPTLSSPLLPGGIMGPRNPVWGVGSLMDANSSIYLFHMVSGSVGYLEGI